MNWNVAINANVVTPGNNLVAAVYADTAPGVVVSSQVVPTPYGTTQEVTFTGLDVIVYRFILWESTSTSPSGSIRAQFSFQPSANLTQVREDLYLTAGLSTGMAVGDTTYYGDGTVAGSLSGWNYSIERVGLGTMFPDQDYTKTNTTWSLKTAGDVFGDAEKFVMRFEPIVQPFLPTGSSATALISDVAILSSDTTLDGTYASKAIILQGSGNTLNITLPASSAIEDNKMFFILSSGGSHINAIIKIQGADTINWLGGVTQIILAQSEQLWLLKNGTTYYVMPGSSDSIKMAGEIVYSYSKQEKNTLFCAGQLLNRSDYPRLFAFVSTLESGCVVSEGSWTNIDANGNYINKAKFTLGDGSTTFRLPLLYNIGYMRAVDGATRFPGNFLDNTIQSHDHELQYYRNDAGGGNQQYVYYLNNDNGPTPLPDGTYKTKTTGGAETSPKNTGIYALIRI